MATDITNIRLGVPAAGILGRVANTPGPPQLLRQADLQSIGIQLQKNPANSAKTAAKWTNPITLTFTALGDVTGTISFDGSANASTALTLQPSGVSAGTYASPASITVDAKGRITAITAGGSPAVWANMLNGDIRYPLPLCDPAGRPIVARVA